MGAVSGACTRPSIRGAQGPPPPSDSLSSICGINAGEVASKKRPLFTLACFTTRACEEQIASTNDASFASKRTPEAPAGRRVWPTTTRSRSSGQPSTRLGAPMRRLGNPPWSSPTISARPQHGKRGPGPQPGLPSLQVRHGWITNPLCGEPQPQTWGHECDSGIPSSTASVEPLEHWLNLLPWRDNPLSTDRLEALLTMFAL